MKFYPTNRRDPERMPMWVQVTIYGGVTAFVTWVLIPTLLA